MFLLHFFTEKIMKIAFIKYIRRCSVYVTSVHQYWHKEYTSTDTKSTPVLTQIVHQYWHKEYTSTDTKSIPVLTQSVNQYWHKAYTNTNLTVPNIQRLRKGGLIWTTLLPLLHLIHICSSTVINGKPHSPFIHSN